MQEIQTCHVVCHPALSTHSDSPSTNSWTRRLPKLLRASLFASPLLFSCALIRRTNRLPGPDPGSPTLPGVDQYYRQQQTTYLPAPLPGQDGPTDAHSLYRPRPCTSTREHIVRCHLSSSTPARQLLGQDRAPVMLIAYLSNQPDTFASELAPDSRLSWPRFSNAAQAPPSRATQSVRVKPCVAIPGPGPTGSEARRRMSTLSLPETNVRHFRRSPHPSCYGRPASSAAAYRELVLRHRCFAISCSHLLRSYPAGRYTCST